MKRTVLIVDDNPTNLALLSEILSPHYRVRVSNGGQRVMDIARSEPQPELILLDVMMPVVDGYQVLAQLKSDLTTANIPVIFVTALNSGEDESRGLEEGVVDYITKPIRPQILLARVKTHLALKDSRDFLTDKNAFLEAEIARRMEETLLTQSASIRALAHLAETRDTETGDHILRTQAYMQVLAEHLAKDPDYATELTPQHIDLLTQSAPLHDIGKVGIPDSILLKPGKLTPDEWKIMKTHAELGARAIERAERDVDRPLPFLRLAKEIAQSHHERWDGHGYPDRLAGTDIPLSARMMALADVFDALISKRVYKEAFSYGDARDIIVKGRGSHFDPKVVDAFEAEFARFTDIAERYGEY